MLRARSGWIVVQPEITQEQRLEIETAALFQDRYRKTPIATPIRKYSQEPDSWRLRLVVTDLECR